MKITVEKLTEMKACPDGIEWFNETFPNGVELKKGAKVALECDQFAFANWFISQQLSDKNKIQYAIYAAELVLHIFEEKYPKDDRPRKAIKAAKNYLISGTDAADAAARAASRAADAAARAASRAADAASDAADAAARAASRAAARAAASAAASAAYAAYAAARAASRAAYAAYAAAEENIKAKIIDYGVSLATKQK